MKKILVVEDNENNLYMMKFMLEENGYQVIEAADGVEGVKLAASEKPDLILMDMQLPLLDGYEATKQIKANEETRNIPIIAVTSFAMVGDKEKTMKAGCDCYIEKPINPETFWSETTQLKANCGGWRLSLSAISRIFIMFRHRVRRSAPRRNFLCNSGSLVSQLAVIVSNSERALSSSWENSLAKFEVIWRRNPMSSIFLQYRCQFLYMVVSP